MKSKLLVFLSLAFVSILFSSYITTKQPISKNKPENNQTYKIEYLFEYDGCKVYRFYDHDNYVYFTNCTGDVTSIKSDSTKTRVNTMINRKPIGI